MSDTTSIGLTLFASTVPRYRPTQKFSEMSFTMKIPSNLQQIKLLHHSNNFTIDSGMPLGLLVADMGPRYAVTAAPVYTSIPVYVLDDSETSLDEVNTTPQLIEKHSTGEDGPIIFEIDPLAWWLYVIEEETEEEMVEMEMEDDAEFWEKAAAWGVMRA